MLRSIARVSALMTLVVPTTVVLVGGCGESVTVADALGSGPIFGSADAGEDAIAPTNEMDAEAVDVLMCPVMTCTFPQATCPSSASPCDVDLLSDDENCGACGVRCSGPGVDHSKWTCVDGKCTFSCDSADRRNCDGNPTNGCETLITDVTNCGACGRQCAEGQICDEGKCKPRCESWGLPDECPHPQLPTSAICTDLRTDDQNCGACGNVCDPTGPDLPPLTSDMYYGCGAEKCGVPKCRQAQRADCNSDLTDGCEVELVTADNCAACGDKCGPGQACLSNPLTSSAQCVCAPGETLCFGFLCVRVEDDPNNC
ncbi:MAG: hypothetical protein BGO98_40255 [Myxococcales bacterium 68-20]|nr:hypothetical protein [Myxococcales bacterium]OJY16220.1 MAG: hypothetical protein BGO98_40255 [Myxococcales bacterium 68-20]